MPAEAILRLNTSTGNAQEYRPVQTSAGVGDAGKVPALDAAGRLDTSMMPVGVSAETVSFVASGAIGVGKFVNLHLANSVLKGRLADNSNGRKAHCFVTTAVADAATGTGFYSSNKNDQLSGMTIGDVQFLGTAGGVTSTVPAAGAGVLVQPLGIAESATALTFETMQTIERAA